MSDLSSIEQLKFETLFGMGTGYVLDFSDRTFDNFFLEQVGINIRTSQYECAGTFKANRLRTFWLDESNQIVGNLLFALLEYWLAKKQINGEEISSKEQTLYDECLKIANRLKQNSSQQKDLSQNNINGKNFKMASETQTPSKVFISDSRKDLNFVEQLASDLKDAGLDVWYDLSGLEGGSRWSQEIEKAIRSSDHVLMVISPDSIKSKWVEEEFLLAGELKKNIIPLHYKTSSIPFGYRTLHFISIQGKQYKQNFHQITRALGVRSLPKPKSPPPRKTICSV
ncbi:MAG: toll/interleukin-1 receptor domain-containing protein [Anaerolineae bacterium]|jgi:hypothetical protein|nr:toll/interleukin-1 receptor domain-containing protein [Anaerolineae bacterium]MBT4681565.1 toll/interleukin-1 receptor domain-containing protein [Chloroflexota bacterium]MBT7484413.1 toll/interleukin-1 receptor domain-containing protein [Candidatus Peregrinibacteria bacterium]MBT3711831.1 toll/interleukin-1 receptor domain-containing protein [Anaerolineae bacterium]MBT4310325.1 toll/interleukin-1 receptor domain-containing protein [Anaerolineae bacterium]